MWGRRARLELGTRALMPSKPMETTVMARDRHLNFREYYFLLLDQLNSP